MSHASPLLTQHLRIHGLVQGVYYRASMVEQARRLGVTGWVRNRLDGSVEALLQGPPEAVQALTLWARQGPAAARVDAVHVQPAPEGTGAMSGFEQVDTV